MAVTVKGKGKHVSRARRHFRLRKKVAGTPERPRLVVSRSNRHMMAQIIDVTIPSSMNPSVKDAMQYVMSRSVF